MSETSEVRRRTPQSRVCRSRSAVNPLSSHRAGGLWSIRIDVPGRGGLMRFGVLGPLYVSDAAGETAITAGRDRVVLAMLLLHAGRIVGVEELIDAVWDDAPPTTARGQLQTCVSRLRRTLAQATILTNPAGYGIEIGDDDLDAAAFVRLTAQGRALLPAAPDDARKLLRQALDLLRGP